MTGPDPPLWNIEFCTHFYIPPPIGVYCQNYRYIRRQFVCEGIYIQETASRNHNLAGYELFMSIYNLQTRTGLNNYLNH